MATAPLTRHSLAFRHAALATLLAFAALNAASYFVRSDRGKLLGHAHGVDRIGFPWLAWQDGAAPENGFATLALGPDGYFDYGGLAMNAGAALVAAILGGLLATAAFRPNGAGKRMGTTSFDRRDAGGPPQFSLRSLLIVTTIVAGVLAYQRAATPQLYAFALAAIYVCGPSVLVCCAWATLGRKRAERLFVVGCALASLIVAAIATGIRTELGDFTRVLLGLYVYWVPQCVLMLAIHATWRVFKSPTRA
ncbi:MAG TPA: hypothetical protein VG125_27970 [Pirellulales bacterium]|jgi:hypothetical protein|nr:hypothetical protein [Pirellulales bacterium]